MFSSEGIPGDFANKVKLWSRVVAVILAQREVMREAVRLALGALVSADAQWLMRWIPASFTQNYSRAISNYRMSEQELAAFIQQTGEEARWLLD